MRYFFFLLLFNYTLICNATTVVTPWGDYPSYIKDALLLALSYSPEKNYQIVRYEEILPKPRVMEYIEKNQGIDIIASGSTNARHQKLMPIKFPLLRGLYGWRIALVNQSNADIFKSVTSVQQLKNLKAGQLHSWSDTEILEKNGLKVVKGSHYQGLFPMLANNRFDYFPRSIIEVDWEYEANKQLPITIDKYRLFHYPTAYYFYVNKNNAVLANDIEKGLEHALADGKLDRLFKQYYGGVIEKVKKEKRLIIELDNPLLPEKTPLSRAELWLNFDHVHTVEK